MDSIKELLNTFDGEIYNLCYKLLIENENNAEVFQYVCENFTGKPKNKTQIIKNHFSQSEIYEYESIYGDIVKGILSNTIKKCDFGMISADEFYKTLWQAYCLNFISDNEKAFAFYYTVVDRKIPYRYLRTPLSMEDDIYENMVKANKSYIDRIEYLLRGSGFRQKTEVVSLILCCLDSVVNFDAKVVILAQALDSYTKSKTDDLTKLLIKRVFELERKMDGVYNSGTKKEETKKEEIKKELADYYDASGTPDTISEIDDTIIKKYPFPTKYHDNEKSNYEFILLKRNDKILLSDQGKTFKMLDQIFELTELDVMKNLKKIQDEYKIQGERRELFIEIINWDVNSNENENEELNEAIYRMFSCVSFMDSMRIFYT